MGSRAWEDNSVNSPEEDSAAFPGATSSCKTSPWLGSTGVPLGHFRGPDVGLRGSCSSCCCSLRCSSCSPSSAPCRAGSSVLITWGYFLFFSQTYLYPIWLSLLVAGCLLLNLLSVLVRCHCCCIFAPCYLGNYTKRNVFLILAFAWLP